MTKLIPVLAVALLYLPHAQAQTTTQDFEAGQGDWYADNGMWEVGTPTVGPAACHQGSQCAGTVLDANSPNTNGRLVSPPVSLGSGTPQNPLLLRFWHWFQWSGSDRGVVQISIYDSVLDQWSAWADVSSIFTSSSGAWTQSLVDLTAFSNDLVRIGFNHQGTHTLGTASGWYIDEVEIPGTQSPSTPTTPWQDFEAGQGNWFADNGMWELGTPTVGPSGCYQGAQCMGTVLDANSPNTNGRLVSPPVQLAAGTAQSPLLLRFWHWFQIPGSDRGVVQISVYDSGLAQWSAWSDISPIITSSSGAWTLNLVDLTPFSNELVRIGFNHQGTHTLSTAAGWYVDEVAISGTQVPPSGFTPWQDFELGQGNWSADNGLWEVGTPTVGPSACTQGSQCAGTVLDGNSPNTNSRLISPPAQLSAGTPENPILLRFWHWFQIPGSDRGVVQISVYDFGLTQWSAWSDISPIITSSSGAWTLNLVDLTPFSNELVRIGFDHQGTHTLSTGPGWYVDDIALSGPSSTRYYVLDSFGGLHPAGGAPPITPAPPYFGFDVARDAELSGNGVYVLDGFGGIHVAGGEPPLTPGPPYFGFDVARDLELAPGGGAFVLDGFGGVHAIGGAPVVNPATFYFGFDIARDLEIRLGGYYVLDGLGGTHAGGGAAPMSPAPPYFDADIAKDIELRRDRGAYVLDGHGGVHAADGAPVLTPPSPYFGFDVARDLELDPGGNGYYVLDGFGGVHGGGGAPVISPPPPYFGFDVARDLEIR